jgi:hypothetical protein
LIDKKIVSEKSSVEFIAKSKPVIGLRKEIPLSKETNALLLQDTRILFENSDHDIDEKRPNGVI